MHFVHSATLFANAWDLKNLLKNGTTFAKSIIGLAAVLAGTVLVGIGGWKGVKKLSGAQSGQQDNWLMILITIIVGGALTVGGGAFLFNLASGGNTTLNDLGNGGSTIMLRSLLHR